jgi:ABC-type sugar transport system permease subunit
VWGWEREARLPGASARKATAPAGAERREARLAWWLAAPALATILLVALFPLLWTLWESVHLHDLRMPWLGRPFIGAANYLEAVRDARFREALAHTLLFTAATVTIELGLGCVLALAMNRAFRGRALVRAAVLVPWAIPTVVSALLWRFIFEGRAGIANALLVDLRLVRDPPVWFIHTGLAWVPVVLADVWKTTPFVALLLLAGLQNIDASLYEAARIDGASAWRQFRHVTLPLLKPAILVALIFRTLDAFRVFDLIYVMTGGGPGFSTTVLVQYIYQMAFTEGEMGYASAIGVVLYLMLLVFTVFQWRFTRQSENA